MKRKEEMKVMDVGGPQGACVVVSALNAGHG